MYCAMITAGGAPSVSWESSLHGRNGTCLQIDTSRCGRTGSRSCSPPCRWTSLSDEGRRDGRAGLRDVCPTRPRIIYATTRLCVRRRLGQGRASLVRRYPDSWVSAYLGSAEGVCCGSAQRRGGTNKVQSTRLALASPRSLDITSE